MGEPTLTAIVLTLNEEKHLQGCLDSIGDLTRSVIVLDSGSSDRTVEIARIAGARVEYAPFKGYASQRNRALELASESDWVLFLDADERLTTESVVEIQERIASAGDEIAGFWIPRHNIVFGKLLRGGGWWPDFQARVIRRGRGRYAECQEVHEIVVFYGATEHLRKPLVHINYESRREFMCKQRTYTLQRAQGGKLTPPRVHSWVTRPAREFVRRFIQLKGYRDGVTGAFLAGVMGFEEVRGCALARRGKQ